MTTDEAMMGEAHACQQCGCTQYSIYDRAYAAHHGRCWECDRKDWQADLLTLEEFESRENIIFSVLQQERGWKMIS